MTVTIRGAQFTAATTASLVDASGNSHPATNITFENSTTLFATFDLTGLATGTYDLTVANPGQTPTDKGAFQVTTGVPGQLVFTLTVPSSCAYSAREWRRCNGRISAIPMSPARRKRMRILVASGAVFLVPGQTLEQNNTVFDISAGRSSRHHSARAKRGVHHTVPGCRELGTDPILPLRREPVPGARLQLRGRLAFLW